MDKPKSTLILAPHQDDEILHCAGLIYNEIQAQHPIYVCFATNGDYDGDAIAQVRKKESLFALKQLGVDKDNIFFLGYSDTGMDTSKSFLFRLLNTKNPDQIFSSRSGRTKTWSPDHEPEWHTKIHGVAATFTQDHFISDLKSLLNEIRPTHVYLPSRYDFHGDHRATYFLFKRANKENRYAVPKKNSPDTHYVSSQNIFQYLIHAGDDLNWPNRKTTADHSVFTEPKTILRLFIDWEKRIRRALPNGFTREDKLALINSFESQTPEGSNGYLESFAKDEEIYFTD